MVSITKLGFAKIIIVGLIFAAPLTTVSFPQVTFPGPQVVDATPYLMPAYGEDTSAISFNIDNYSLWSLSPSSSVAASLNASANSLVFQGTFPPATAPSAATISRSLFVNLTKYPILYVSMKVSAGTGYGIRFFSRLDGGSSIALWSDDDALNHRKGTGQFEDIQVNIERLIQSNTARAIPTLTEIRVFVERGASSGITAFELQLQKLKFFAYPLKPAESPGAYHSLYFTLRRPQVSSSWTLQTVTLEGDVDASTGTSYLVYLLSSLTIYRIGPFKHDPASENRVYNFPMSMEPVKAFSEVLPVGEFSLVMVASSGVLHQFGNKKIMLTYYSSESKSSSPIRTGTPDSQLAVLGGLLFLFFSILLFEQVRFRRSLKTSIQASPVARDS